MQDGQIQVQTVVLQRDAAVWKQRVPSEPKLLQVLRRGASLPALVRWIEKGLTAS